MKKYKIFFETCESIGKKKIKNVNAMITSPPYWDLKNYESENQIGYKESYEVYMERMYLVWQLIFDSLTKNGIAIININTKSFNRSLKLIPYDFIKQLEKIGFYFLDILYWHKSSGIPATRNLKDNFEYFLIFSKSKEIKFNKEKYFFDYKKISIKDQMTNIWNINKKFGSVGKNFMVHPAIFPPVFIERLLELFTSENDVILDPFMGSGSTLIACMKLKRKCIGFELNNKEYKKLIIENLKSNDLDPKKVDFIFN